MTSFSGVRPGRLYPSSEAVCSIERYREAMELGKPSVFEHRSVVSGEWMEVRVYPTATGISAYYREIEERKRIEQEVVATRAELAATLAAITNGFYTLDRTWRVTYMNDKAAEVFPGGKKAIGANFWELFPADVGSAYEACKRKAMEQSEVCSFEFLDPASDAWFEERDYPSADGITILFSDITERKRAEAQRDQLMEARNLLLEAATAAAAGADLDRMLESLGDLLLRATDHSRVLLELWDEERREVEIAVSRGAAATRKQRFAFDGISDGAKEVITTRKTLVIDYAATGIPGPQKAYVDEHAFLLMLVVPIIYRERLIGLITADQPGEARPFSPREIELVEAIAAQAGAAIENARLFEAERQAQQQSAQDLEATRLLLEAASKLNSWTSIDGLLNGLADVVLRATRHTRAYVALLAEDRSQATFVTTVGKDPLPARTVLAWDQLSSVLQDVLTDGRRKIVDYNELRAAYRGIADSLASRLALLVPILFGDRVLGHIAIDDPGERSEFTDREIALIEGIASQAAVAIENARLYDAQRHIATTLQDNLIHPLPKSPASSSAWWPRRHTNRSLWAATSATSSCSTTGASS